MSAIRLRLPDSLHDAVRELAEKDNVSINQFITVALAEKVSALMTEDYLAMRAKGANKEKFEAAMQAVAAVELDDVDRL